MARGVPANGVNAGWFRAGDPKLKVKSESHRQAIAEGQRRAWETTRKRMPNGSIWIDASGYVREKVGEGKWRLQHVLRMEREIGRPIRKGEIVHHIDGDRQNNVIGNLYLCRSHAHHMEVERALVALFRQLLKDGVVRFNFAAGTYER